MIQYVFIYLILILSCVTARIDQTLSPKYRRNESVTALALHDYNSRLVRNFESQSKAIRIRSKMESDKPSSQQPIAKWVYRYIREDEEATEFERLESLHVLNRIHRKRGEQELDVPKLFAAKNLAVNTKLKSRLPQWRDTTPAL